MGYRGLDSGLFRPALYASMLTAGLTGIALATDSYIGSPYGSTLAVGTQASLGAFAWTLLGLLILFVPGAIFGILAVLPLAWLAGAVALRFETTRPALRRLHWPLGGALLGGPALLLYSFPLGLGQTLIGQLVANGIVCGLFCACLMRLFIRTDIVDAAIVADTE